MEDPLQQQEKQAVETHAEQGPWAGVLFCPPAVVGGQCGEMRTTGRLFSIKVS